MESKYKVGDKVRVKSLEWYNSNKDEDGEIREDGQTFLKCMSEYCGKEYEVSYVYPNGICILKEINWWWWYDWMFEDEVIIDDKQQQILEQIERVQTELDKLRLLYNN